MAQTQLKQTSPESLEEFDLEVEQTEDEGEVAGEAEGEDSGSDGAIDISNFTVLKFANNNKTMTKVALTDLENQRTSLENSQILEFHYKGKPLLYRNLSSKLSLGRGEQADIKIEDSHMGSEHCHIYLQNNLVSIVDLGSKSGTLINKERMRPHKMYVIDTEDVVSIGYVSFFLSKDNPNLQDMEASQIEFTEFELSPWQKFQAKWPGIFNWRRQISDLRERWRLTLRSLFKRQKNINVSNVQLQQAPAEGLGQKLKSKWKVTKSNILDLFKARKKVNATEKKVELYPRSGGSKGPGLFMRPYCLLFNLYLYCYLVPFLLQRKEVQELMSTLWEGGHPLFMSALEFIKSLQLEQYIGNKELIHSTGQFITQNVSPAWYPSIILTLLILMLEHLLMGVPVSYALVGISGNRNLLLNRCFGLSRLLLTLLFFPLWILDLLLLFLHKRPIREVLTFCQLQYNSTPLRILGAGIILPLSLLTHYYSPFWRQILMPEKMSFQDLSSEIAKPKNKKEDAETIQEFTGKTLPAHFKVSLIQEQNFIPLLGINSYNGEPYIRLVSEKNQEIKVIMLPEFSWKKLLSEASSLNPTLPIFYPAIDAFLQEPSQTLPALTAEMELLLKNAFALDQNNFLEYLQKSGPVWHTSFMIKDRFLSLAQKSAVEGVRLLQLGDAKFVAIQLAKGQQQSQFILLPLFPAEHMALEVTLSPGLPKIYYQMEQWPKIFQGTQWNFMGTRKIASVPKDKNSGNFLSLYDLWMEKFYLSQNPSSPINGTKKTAKTGLVLGPEGEGQWINMWKESLTKNKDQTQVFEIFKQNVDEMQKLSKNATFSQFFSSELRALLLELPKLSREEINTQLEKFLEGKTKIEN